MPSFPATFQVQETDIRQHKKPNTKMLSWQSNWTRPKKGPNFAQKTKNDKFLVRDEKVPDSA